MNKIKYFFGHQVRISMDAIKTIWIDVKEHNFNSKADKIICHNNIFIFYVDFDF